MTPSPKPYKDFLQYKSDLETHPFERTIEHFRRVEILGTLNSFRHLKLEIVLEVGIGLRSLARDLDFPRAITLVEPIVEFLDRDKRENHRVSTNHFAGTLQEYYQSARHHAIRFDLIILSSVLHEVPSQSEALTICRELLSPSGVLVIVVPNKLSFHRLVGKGIGVIKSDSQRTDAEVQMGQRAAYSPGELISDLTDLDFEVVLCRTFFPKLLSSGQMERAKNTGLLDPSLIETLYRSSAAFEPFGSEIICVARSGGRAE